MFYETKLNNHGLKYNPFKSCVVPRPIAWVSTISENKTINLAPYSYFNAISDIPPVIMFSSANHAKNETKDSMRNILTMVEFVVNICSFEGKNKMHQSGSALAYGVSEADAFDIQMSDSHLINTPSVQSSKIAMECQLIKTEKLVIENHPVSSTIIFGHVIGIYIDNQIIEDGKISIAKLKPVARLGYDEYCVIETVFSMSRNS